MSPPARTAQSAFATSSPADSPRSGPSPSSASRANSTDAPTGIGGSAASGESTTITRSHTSSRRATGCWRRGLPWYSSASLSRPNRRDRPPASTTPATSLPSPAVALPSALHVGEPEPPLDAEVAARDRVILGRRHLHDLVVLDVDLELTTHSAVRADRVGDGLRVLVPRPLGAHVVLRLEHQ